MSKFFKIGSDFVNLSQIANIKFNEDRFTITFECYEKHFYKNCANEEQFKSLKDIVLSNLEVIDLDDANEPKKSMFDVVG